MRIMLDTNVLISLFVFKGKKFEDLLLKVSLLHTLVLSSHIISELYDVVQRKFSDKTKYVDLFLERIPYELTLTPEYLPDHNLFTIRDNNDDKVLFSAIVADVDIFITGDKDFLDVNIERPLILTPAEFLESY